MHISSFDDYVLRYQDHCSMISAFEHQVERHADQVYLRYWDGEAYKSLTYTEVDNMATHLSWKLKDLVDSSNTLALLADQSAPYFIYVLACLKLRILLVILSPRNSEAAVAHLLKATNSKLILSIDKYRTLAEGAASQTNARAHSVQMDIKALLLLKDKVSDPVWLAEEDETVADNIAVIIHSSGSTSFPKPIHLSNRYLITGAQNFALAPVNDAPELLPVAGDVLLSCLPMYHMSGFLGTFMMSVVGGAIVFLPRFPPSPREVLAAIEANQCSQMNAPPMIMRDLIPVLEETRNFEPLRRLKAVVVGGANLIKDAGDYYHANGVNVCNVYGTTEINVALTCNMKNVKGKPWDALKPIHAMKEYVRWLPWDGDANFCSLVLRKECPAIASNVINRDDGDHDTNDIFAETSPGSGLWSYVGRKDDILVMENGEKTNPVPMEAVINLSPIVKVCCMVGEGLQCTSVLIQLNIDYALKLSPQGMIDEVHEVVENANKDAPNHSYIYPQMVYILPLNQQLPHTDKGTVPRKKVLQEFAKEIQGMYEYFIGGSVPPTPMTPMFPTSPLFEEHPSTWGAAKIRSYLEDESAKVLRRDVGTIANDTSQSLFDLGLNSLSSIQLRGKVAQKFPEVAQNFLFEHPSIDAMVAALTLNDDDKDDTQDTIEQHYHETEAILGDYLRQAKAEFGVAKNAYLPGVKQVVLLTGATGAVGAFILRDLLLSDNVSKVYALVRMGAKTDGMGRLRQAFSDRGLDVTLLESKVEVLPMNLEADNLGFSDNVYHRLKGEVTMIQACGWLLDFNHTISHFERECIRGFYNLLKFAYRPVNPMHVHTISSVSASARLGSEIEETPLPRDPYIALPMGYAQSKYIVEHLMNYLSRRKHIPCFIHRLGQVCGDSENGSWNHKEQYPIMMVGGGQMMKKMPNLSTRIDWIPVNYAASSIVEIMHKTADQSARSGQSIFHIVNPSMVSWSQLLDNMRQCGMEFDVVSPIEWIQALKGHEDNPAYKLMAFYENSFGADIDFPEWKTEKTVEIAPILGNAPHMGTDLLEKYLGHWRQIGFCQ